MLKFLIDECLPQSVTVFLRDMGYDAIDVYEIGLKSASNDEIFAIAQRDNRIVITKDKGFGNPLKYPLESSQGIIIVKVPSNYTSKKIVATLKKFFESINIESIKKSLIIVEPSRY
ncbi:MAG: DUF5615 family PIN-like protein, partial [Methanosarcinales archaeon]